MFYLLLLVPLMVGVWIVAVQMQKRRIRKFGDPQTVARLMPDASPRRMRNKFILLLASIALIVTALARPQSGAKLTEHERTGVELMLVVDVSNSMLAEDLHPNRLESTRMAVGRLMNDLGQNRVGIVVFAGEAYVLLPITSDLVTARTFAGRLSPGMVVEQGTAMGAAIELAANSFSSASEGSRVMIVISDGENHEDDPLEAAMLAAGRGIVIHTIGIGTPEGSPIMLDGDYIRDENGQIVVSKLDEAMLQRVALATGGAYVRATNRSLGLAEIVEMVNNTESATFRAMVFDEWDEYFRWLLIVALALLLAEMLMLDRKSRIFARFNVFR